MHRIEFSTMQLSWMQLNKIHQFTAFCIISEKLLPLCFNHQIGFRRSSSYIVIGQRCIYISIWALKYPIKWKENKKIKIKKQVAGNEIKYPWMELNLYEEMLAEKRMKFYIDKYNIFFIKNISREHGLWYQATWSRWLGERWKKIRS